MAIQERPCKGGTMSYRVTIRKNATEVSKTFSNLEDAQLFEHYRTRLIECMDNFEVPASERVRLVDILDLKIRRTKEKRAVDEFYLAGKRIMDNIRKHTFVCELNYDDWVECFKKISTTEMPKRHNSKDVGLLHPKSLRRIFASLSSAFSTAIINGIDVVNHPLKIVQDIINPSMKNKGI
jgi:hypothetical protein